MNNKRVLILSGLSLAAMLGGFLLLEPTAEETAPPEVGTYRPSVTQAVPTDVQYMLSDRISLETLVSVGSKSKPSGLSKCSALAICAISALRHRRQREWLHPFPELVEGNESSWRVILVR